MIFSLAILTLPMALAQNAVQIQNGQDAKRLDDAKFSNTVGSPCTGTDVVCVGDQVGRCQNGVFAITSPCAGGLSCQVLPLVNKPGTSVACDTESDKIARFTAAGVGASIAPEAVAPPAAQVIAPPVAAQVIAPPVAAQVIAPPVAAQVIAPPVAAQVAPAGTGAAPTGGNQAGDFICIDDTSFQQFTSATNFVVNKCAPGFCATRNPPKKNPCIGKANADRVDGALAKVKRRLYGGY